MKLLELTLRNFRAARDAGINPEGLDLDIYGLNGLGKTTYADAFYWLLFDKDSLGDKTFRLKTEDEDGNPLHHLEHSVRGVFLLADGERLTLEKTLKENWVTTRGHQNRKFEGHTTDYKVNGVPVKAGEYNQWIASICEERRFRLLTDPTHFIHQLTWQERRKLLIEVCGDISDSEVIESDEKLAALPAILGKRTIDDHRKVIKARRLEVAKEIEGIPGRLDELNRSLPKDAKAWEDPRPALRIELGKCATEKATIRSGGQIAEFRKALAILEGKEQDLLNRLQRETNVAALQADAAADEITKELGQIEANESTIRFKLNADREALTGLEARLKRHVEIWREIKAQTYEWVGEEICMNCQRPLDASLVEEAKQRGLEEFNLQQSEKLAANIAEGKTMNASKTMLVNKIADREAELAALPDTTELKARRDSHRATAEELRQQTKAPAVDKDLIANRAEQERVKGDIRILEGDASALIADLDKKEAELNASIQEADAIAARLAHAAEAKARITELTGEQTKLSAELGKLEMELALCEDFVRAKVSMLDEKINRRFKIARFRLFENQINEGLREVCDVTYGGKPGSHGEKVKVGLDIIQTLSEHFGFAPPIFIDNAESVTDIPATTGQQIRLRVSEADASLRVVAAKSRVAVTA